MGKSAVPATAAPVVSLPVPVDGCDLLELLAGVPDGRTGQGRDHPVAFLASAGGRTFHLACLAEAYPSPDAVNRVDDRIRSVTPAQIQQAATWLQSPSATALNSLPWKEPA